MGYSRLLSFTILATIHCTESLSFASQTPKSSYLGLVKKIITGSGKN